MVQHTVDNYQTMTLEAYRAIFLNSITDMDVKQELKEQYLGVLDKLTLTHIRILKLLSNPGDHFMRIGIPIGSQQFGSLMVGLKTAFPDYTENQIRAAWYDLRSSGLVGLDANSLAAPVVGPTEVQLAGQLSAFGREFVDFIRNPVTLV